MSRTPLFSHRAVKRPIAAAISLITACSCAAAFGQDKILEEVIVTSQIRAQNLLEVPNSVTAVTGEKIERMGVQNLEDLTSYAPAMHFTETGLSTQVRLRGIGSDNSQGFEQSVGLYMDGIFRGRAQLFRVPIYDMERVEVMRGPQGTLFGKNTIAGALDLITAKPTDHLTGRASARYETEFGAKEINGFVSGPITDDLRGRLAMRYYDDPGYMTNTTLDRDEADQEEKSVRATLDWTPMDELQVMFSASRDTFDVLGRPMEITQDLPAPGGLSYGQVLGAFGATLDTEQDYRRQTNTSEFSNNVINSQTLRIDYDWNGFTFSSITGALDFDYDERCECDFTPVNFFHLDVFEGYEQFSQEFRVISPSDNTVEWLGGIFYQTYDQTFTDLFTAPIDSALVPAMQTLVPTFPNEFAGTGIDRDFAQSSDTWAVFGEATWNLRHDLRLTLSGRFTKEEKDAHRELNIVNTMDNNAIIDDNIVLAGVYQQLFRADTEQFGDGHSLTGSRSESVFTPSFNVSYDFNDDIMTYAKASRGFKAGGFDPRSNDRDFFEFEPEEVIALEAGSKMRLADGRGELNVALYRMDYDNLQISQFDGAVGFNVGNAGETRVQGIEVDGRWQLTDKIIGNFGVAYLDFEYKDFQNGNCYVGQTPDANGFCDYTGQRGVYTPEWSLNGSLEYMRALTHNIQFVSTLDVQWVDEQQVHVNLDPNGMIGSYTDMALRIALESHHWELALLGRNLLNEDIQTYSANLPLSETITGGASSYYSFLRRPRTVAVEATYKF